MPGYILAPADKVTASYDNMTQVLTLRATGKAPAYLYGFNFDRELILGGLKFSFHAWWDHAYMGDQDVDHSQTFYLPNLRAVDPTMTTIIVDSTHPKGRIIPITPVLHDGDKPQSNGTDTGKAQTNDESKVPDPIIPITSLPIPIPIKTLYGDSFSISRAILGSQDVQIKHNNSILTLETAGYDSGNINWTFKSLQTGITEVIVTTASDVVIHDAPIITKQIYVITILPPINTLSLPSPSEILSFKGCVVIAQREVEQQFTNVHLLDVFVKQPSGIVYPVKDPNRLSQMRCFFSVEKFGLGQPVPVRGTVTLTSTGWGTFDQPEFVEGVYVGLQNLDIKDLIGIDDAADDMRKAGIDLGFFSCDLSAMLVAPPEDQPYYVFAMENGSYTSVGAKDGKVRNVPAILKGLPSKEGGKKIGNGA